MADWKRRQWLGVLGFLALLVGLPAGALFLYLATYWRDLTRLEAALEAIPGVRVERIWGNEDLTLEDLGAKLALERGGTLMFFNLELDSIVETDHLHLAQVGQLQVVGCGELIDDWICRAGQVPPCRTWTIYSSGSIDLASPGWMRDQLRVRARSVREAVDLYDELLAELSTWPRAPRFAEFTDSDGFVHRYATRLEGERHVVRCDDLRRADPDRRIVPVRVPPSVPDQ